MLDTATKRRIDTARDILVGKVPDPKSQVEQITIALIYKFMDDMDALSEELGGVRKFFADGFSQYGWARLMRSGLGGHEALNLYAEAIAKMPENPGLPPLFRTIFKNAYLPYRDPETLRAFLKIIDEFEYDHSERLGDAYEYLLSVLGSQGDAGQFRTPRHIIDFLVAVVDPKKHEVIIDPAAGTAGFLIASYKHILRENTNAGGVCTLTPDEKARLAQNLRGYDISPDMVRLALVNMYLHGFTDPHIHEYDTLTSLDRWNEHADVFMANPPFMSPKGGIRPHNRFTVQSKRSEVLFVNYMAEHLTPNGRAGIIVPEGIIFQSQTAYKQLRKMLVRDSLVAVISLPAGVFQPYSGVKTSILILDKSLAKRSSTIGFFKADNDGYALGAQRRPIDKNDLPLVLTEITEYLRRQRAGESLDDFQPTRGLIVERDKVAANGEYNLSGERYREVAVSASTFPIVSLGEVCELVRGVVFSKTDEVSAGGVQVLRANNIDKDRNNLNLDDVKQVAPKVDFSADKKLKKDDIFICLASGSKDHIGKVALITSDTNFYFGGFMGAIRVNKKLILHEYLFKLLTVNHFNTFLREQISGANINNLSGKLLYQYKIPLPPLEVQKEIVAEIEGYQRVIDGARAVIDNYRPHIPIDPEWPMGKLMDVSKLISGQHIDKVAYNSEGRGVSYLTGPSDFGLITPVVTKWTESPKVIANKGDILITVKGSGLGSVNLLDIEEAAISRQLMAVRVRKALPAFIHIILKSKFMYFQNLGYGAAIPGITREDVLNLHIPLPPLSTQQAIVAEIKAEQKLVDANRELVSRMEKKIQAALARVWGEDGDVADKAAE